MQPAAGALRMAEMPRAAGRKKTASQHGAPLCDKPQIHGRVARNGHLRIALIANFSSCLVEESAAAWRQTVFIV